MACLNLIITPGRGFNPCSPRRKWGNPEGVTDFGVCRTFGQGFRFAPYPAYGLSYLRSGIPLRSIPCLGSVVPSALRRLVARKAGVTRYALHHLPGVFRPFGATVPLSKSPLRGI